MKQAIQWMADNKVASNIMMIFFLVGGIFTIPNINQEVFPDIQFDVVVVTVIYKNAGPSEVENSICLPLEEAVSDLNGIDQITCTAKENVAAMAIEVKKDYDVNQMQTDVTNKVNALDNLPVDAERPSVVRAERRRDLMELYLSGPTSEAHLFDLADQLKDQISALDGVSYVELGGIRGKEIRIEADPDALNRHNLSLNQLGQIIGSTSLNLPAGSVRTKTGAILLRTQAEQDQEFGYEQLPILTNPNGAVLRLGELAKVTKGLAERESFIRFDAKPAVMIKIYQEDSITPSKLSEKILAYVEKTNASLPDGLKLHLWDDRSEIFKSRLELLLKNASMGLILVFVSLTLFLEVRLAFWVMLGVPISFMGCLVFLPSLGVSINMISMFAFILVSGIVVDDAIVVGEAAYQRIEQGEDHLKAAVEGTARVAGPVIFAVLTTMVAFFPLLYIEGTMGKFLYAMPIIIIAVLGVSLVEGLFILPSHVAHTSFKPLKGVFGMIDHVSDKADKGLKRIIYGRYTQILKLTLRHRYSTVALGVSVLALCAGLVISGKISMEFFPSIEGDNVSITVELPPGFPAAETIPMVERVEAQAKALVQRMDQELGVKEPSLLHVKTDVEGQPARSSSGAANFEVNLMFIPGEVRTLSTFAFQRRLQQELKKSPEMVSLSSRSRGMRFGTDIQVSFSHEDQKLVKEVTEEFKQVLTGFQGVADILDSEKQGSREYRFQLTPAAVTLGITPSYFAAELRAAFSGLEIATLKRGKDEIPVMLSFPSDYRDRVNRLLGIKIKAPSGGLIALGEAAEIKEAVEPVSIRRVDRLRVIDVEARVDAKEGNLDRITEDLTKGWLAEIQARHPGLKVVQEGASKERKKSLMSLLKGFMVALLCIYALLAVFFRNYHHPLAVMSAIPFGIAGAVLGHGLLGYPLSFISLFGLVGLTGVVVNDSLILIDAVNEHPHLRQDPVEALIQGTQSRVRPIMLTTLTTFAGMTPMLLETSRQARFLIPMSISLGVGILFATMVTLILVPSFYLILEDLRNFRASLLAKRQKGLLPEDQAS